MMPDNQRYTCADYRQEMILLSLHHRLGQKGLSETEKESLIKEIKQLEALMCLADKS